MDRSDATLLAIQLAVAKSKKVGPVAQCMPLPELKEYDMSTPKYEERSEWYDAMEYTPGTPGLYEAAYEMNGAMIRYDGLRLWTGVRWLHLNLNHQTLFPQKGDFFRGLKIQDRRVEARKKED